MLRHLVHVFPSATIVPPSLEHQALLWVGSSPAHSMHLVSGTCAREPLKMRNTTVYRERLRRTILTARAFRTIAALEVQLIARRDALRLEKINAPSRVSPLHRIHAVFTF